MSKKKTPFVRFLSSVQGHIVSRYPSNEPIGVRVVRGDVEKTLWLPDVIAALTAEEAAQYRREYDMHVRDGALTERTEDEYLAFIKRQEANDKGPPKPDETKSDQKTE